MLVVYIIHLQQCLFTRDLIFYFSLSISIRIYNTLIYYIHIPIYNIIMCRLHRALSPCLTRNLRSVPITYKTHVSIIQQYCVTRVQRTYIPTRLVWRVWTLRLSCTCWRKNVVAREIEPAVYILYKYIYWRTWTYTYIYYYGLNTLHCCSGVQTLYNRMRWNRVDVYR